MNEQIEKLFDQALEEFKAENKYATIVVPDPLQRNFVEKFAELIVRECAKAADEGLAQVTMKVEWPSYHIKKHFGVEE